MIEDKDLKSRLTYTLKKPHTHDGVDYSQADIDEGIKIELDEDTAKVLLEQGIIDAQAAKDSDGAHHKHKAHATAKVAGQPEE